MASCYQLSAHPHHCRAARHSVGAEHPHQQLEVDLRQLRQISHRHLLVDLVDGGVDRAQFDHLGTGQRNETAIGSAPEVESCGA